MKASYLCMMWHVTQDINHSLHQVLMERLFLKSEGKAHEAHRAAVCFLTKLPANDSSDSYLA